MSSLHTINRSPDSNLLESCIKVVSAGDAILFIEDGVYHCTSPINLQTTMDSVEAIDTARFVELCCEHDKVVSWF